MAENTLVYAAREKIKFFIYVMLLCFMNCITAIKSSVRYKTRVFKHEGGRRLPNFIICLLSTSAKNLSTVF